MSKGGTIIAFLGGCLVAVGLLIAGLCGLCTWSFADSLGSLALLFGAVPILAGLVIAGAGLALLIEFRRKPKRPA